MRIGLSISVIQGGKTGVAQYVFALLRGLKAFTPKHQFILFVLEHDAPLFEFIRGSMEIVPVAERFRPAIKNVAWHQTHLPRLVAQHRLDVLHIPSYRRMLWRRPCALVSTIHDLAPFHVPDKYDWKRMFYGRVIARRLAHRQHRIIAISENTARDITHFFKMDRSRITVVHNGLEHERFFPGSREQAKAFAASRYQLHNPFFLYVARLEHPAKNHLPLISAFERFKTAAPSDWQLALAGSDWHGADVIHDAIRKSPAAAEIKTLGFVPDEHLPDLYRAADVFVYPSLYEGFGLPPIEAMACGCPVISSSRGSLAEVVGDAGAIVEPTDIDSIARQLQLFASDPSVRERYRAAGLVRAKLFDWNRTAAATAAVYEAAARECGTLNR
jgi:glycosyltransferase involved in cell wall biosynthesis